MSIKEISWEEGEKRILKDPGVVKECERLEPEFQVLRKLIFLRKKSKISQQKLAEKINMRQSHISRLETGEVTPTLKTLKRYAKGLDRVIAFNVTTQDEYHKKRSFA